MAIAIIGYFSRWFVNHPEVVTEYGVHWNFFWTIAVVNLASSTITSPRFSLSTSMGMYIIYQLFLSFGGSEFIFNASRDNFFTKNREGILGCFGYICIYMIGIAYADIVIKKSHSLKLGWKSPSTTYTLSRLIPVNIVAGIGTFF